MRKIGALLLLLLLVWGFIWVNNNWIQTTEFTIESDKLPEAFDGKKIVQISDLHDAEFGDGQASLIEKVEAAEPDAIFLTGDLIDSNRYDLDTSLTLVDALVEMSEVYYVLGNHEVAVNKIDEITEALAQRGVHVLMNESMEWEIGGESVQIAGINDPLIDVHQIEEDFTRRALEEAAIGEGFTLLLAHRPEMFRIYAEEQIDLVFAGHAHGGQIRFPGLGGLFAPGQGWFPTMTEGLFEEQSTRLVLSRGLGNSGFPVRVFNLPEIIVVTLEKA